MKDLLDDLFTGTVSRRKFMQRASAAGLALPLLGGAFVKTADAQGQKKSRPETKPTGVEQENPVYSPANIGGGVRIDRNFYRDWAKYARIPKYDNPHSVFDVKTHEVQY